MISVRFQGKPFNIRVIQVYAPTSNAEEAEVEQFYKDLLELILKKDVLFMTEDWKATQFKNGQRFLQRSYTGISLAAHWLRICIVTALGAGLIPGQETKILHGVKW